MDLSESDNPLLNDYKLKYVLKLLPQTFLGGLQLKFNFNVPLYIYIAQILLWVCPLAIGTIFALIVELNGSDEELCALIFGVTMFVIYTAVHVVVMVLKRRLSSVQRTSSHFATEGDDIEFVSFLSMETFEFLIPKKRCAFNYLFHPIICGVVCAFSFLFLHPQRTNLLFSNTVGCWFYYVVGWISVCIACYSLIGQNTKEPAIFHITDSWEIISLSRACYVIGFGVFSYAARSSGGSAIVRSIDYSIHIFFILLPFLWLFGFLPPLDALLAWVGEQVLIHMLGGVSTANDIRLVIALITSWLSVIVFHFIPLKIVAVIILASLSILVSLDVSSFIMTLMSKVSFGSTKIKDGVRRESGEGKQGSKQNTFRCIGYVLLVFVMANIITVLSEIYFTKLTSYRFNVIAGIMFFIAVLNKLLCSFQQVYIFFSVIRNPFYSKVSKRYGRMWLFCAVSCCVRLIILPLWLVLTISMLLITKQDHPRSFISSILMFRAYRMVWQNTPRCTYDVLIYSILIWSKFSTSIWDAFDPTVQLFVLSMILYFIITFVNKVWFIFIITLNSRTKEKSQRKKVNTAITVAISLLPFTLFAIVITVLTTSPLLPLFTLPLFIVGFPRPLRMWPEASAPTRSSSKDWIYYQQLSSSIAEEIEHKFQTNGLNTFEAGSYFLGRFQDRLVWLSILETGFTHCNFIIKGLELQETSCHTKEAEVVDDIFQSSLDIENKHYNDYISSVLTAKFSLDVHAYSDARNVLTGVIDSPEFLESVSEFFPKTLLWVLMRHCLHKRKMGLQDERSKTTHPIDQGSLTTFRSDETSRSIESRVDDQTSLSRAPLVKNDGGEETFIISPHQGDQNTALRPIIEGEPKINIGKSSPKQNLAKADDSDDEFGDFGFDDECSESDISEGLEDHNEFNAYIKSGTPEHYTISNASKVIEPLPSWKDTIPFNEEQLSKYFPLISQGWYECILSSFNLNESHIILRDNILFKMYKILVLSCYYIVNIAGVHESSPVKEGPRHVLKVFYGEFPWSPNVSWIEDDDELKDLVVQAYRYAFKLALDNHVIAEINDDDEVLAKLTEYDECWFLGEENSDDWVKSVLEEKSYLLSIFQEEQEYVFTSRSLCKQLMEVPIGELNKECVCGFWAALSLELYYMTNDDDERYSIQALPFMLRNIITQAADPPLGYPVYSSGLISVHI